ncbi:MAG: hypothetical protein A2639_01920 [Candidatus Staskawiczbacteria bacterium RIFCSPHIGHO2_01_FULL_34_27]|uniref:Uncharacterized protein n=1 Tax=Candidatus Staskawiczbacteria bacterium RIFCSPHIGHO2_01_FULL_34_27 TaxID=1802199 RepID=A0A1G2HKV9_9BACT|nr:MAG: hypothetical protein A2639_01920 [Candidatus Staskawiczbacteria bacterium RIFCSPHIGHO2_01_FULL_34_27]
MKIKYFFFYSITVPNTSEKPEKVLDRWILRYLDGGKDIQEEISSFKEEEDRLCDKEGLTYQLHSVLRFHQGKIEEQLVVSDKKEQ